MTPKTKSFWLAALGPVMVILNFGVLILIGWFALKIPTNYLRAFGPFFGITLGTTPPSNYSLCMKALESISDDALDDPAKLPEACGKLTLEQRYVIECSAPAISHAKQLAPKGMAGLTSEQRATVEAVIDRCIADVERKD